MHAGRKITAIPADYHNSLYWLSQSLSDMQYWARILERCSALLANHQVKISEEKMCERIVCMIELGTSTKAHRERGGYHEKFEISNIGARDSNLS